MVKVKSCAKINFFLDIKGTDDKDYHLVETVMSSVGLGDIMTVNKNGTKKINITCKGVEEEQNTAYKAANLFMEKFGVCGFDIEINKNIPFCSGLGGSSADAAGVLFALSKLYDINKEQLKDICVKCGSDVFYMLCGGFAVASGRGEILSPFKCNYDYDIVLAKPRRGVTSKQAYTMYDKLSPFKPNCSASDVADALEKKDFDKLKHCCQNALYRASRILVPQIATVLDLLKRDAFIAFMSGSGSVCAGVFKHRDKAQNCAKKIVREGFWAVCTKTQNKGVIVL